MKIDTLALTAMLVVAGVFGVFGAADNASNANAPIELLSPTDALKAVQEMDLPDGVRLSGIMELLQQPATSESTTANDNESESEAAMATGAQSAESLQEYWAGGALGLGLGLGRWGALGLGGICPYRFGFSCGGLNGWAYPLSYWNTFGAGLYGGGCGLGVSFGGLYYC